MRAGNGQEDGMARRVMMVTGGSRGIGAAAAILAAGRGYDLLLTYRNETARAEATASACEAKGARVVLVQGDAGAEGDILAAFQRLDTVFGRLDVLVNNAGIQRVAPIEELPPAEWDRVLAISLDSAFHTIRAALPDMVARGWGRIINIASAHGLRASPFKSAYVATKHGVVGLTKAVALETAEKGITVNAICPGYVWTPLVARQVADQARVHGLEEEEVIREIFLAPQPTRQFVQPEEIAELAAYLCGDLARSITGAAISIDGGWTAK
jgi:3-hydroxybutyrate dehydrogenase